MELIFSKSKKHGALTLKVESEEVLVTNSFKKMAEYLTQEYPDETESLVSSCNYTGIMLIGFDSETKEQIHHIITRTFCQENNPCSEIQNEEW